MHIPLNFFLGCAGAGLLGIILQVILKINSLKAKSKAANMKFSYKEYFSEDGTTILLSFVVLGIAIVTLDELLKFKPSIQSWIKFFFVFVGYTGSSILQYVFGTMEKKIMALIDAKTNVADTVTGGTTTVAETLRKGEEATGQPIVAPLPHVNDEP